MEELLRAQAIVALRALGKRGRTSRIPRPVRESVLSYVSTARRKHVPWRTLAGELGLSATVMQRWLRAAAPEATRQRGGLLPVVVREHRSVEWNHCALVTPSGLRMEGLRLVEVAELVRLLS
jgi:hypothetical protein